MTAGRRLPRRWQGRNRDEVLEEILRPSSRLGYNRNELGLYFLGREALALAETQFRRAVWVNPFEPRFRFNWASSLYRLGRYAEAVEQLEEVLSRTDGHADAMKLLELCRRHEGNPPDAPSTGP
jgi:tetratricopeptide (TPR) repeat protein